MDRVGNYVIEKEISGSNYSFVYKCVKTQNKAIAIKIAREPTTQCNTLITREYEILSKFKHPNIISVFDYGTDKDKRAFFTMEYIDGGTLRQKFKGYSKTCLEALMQVVYALITFHSKGYVHGDLKIDNIMYVPRDKRVALIDFAFAGIPHRSALQGGTLDYIAPEIMKGMGIDQRSDLYSLGVIMYEVFGDSKPPENYSPLKNIPGSINKMIQRLLLHEPTARGTIPELYDVLAQFVKKPDFNTSCYKVRLPQLVYTGNSDIIDKLLKTNGTALFIKGDTGIGKTRLLQEIRYESVKKNRAVLYHSGSKNRHLYETFMDFLDLKAEDTRDRDNSYQVYALIASALARNAQKQPISVLVDDLDYLSEYDIDLFRYIGHGIKTKNITLIGSVTKHNKIADVGFEVITLKPLQEKDVETLLARTFHSVVQKGNNRNRRAVEFTHWLYTHSGGYPFFIEEILHTVYRNNAIVFQKNIWYVDMSRVTEISVPATMEHFISRRIAECTKRELEILRILALVDRPVDSILLDTLLDFEYAYDLEQLKACGLIIEYIEDNRRLVFIPNLILAEKVRDSIAKNRIKKYRTYIIDAIKASALENYYIPVLAQLYMNIDDYETAYSYLLRSAKRAELIHDYFSARKYYGEILRYENGIHLDKGSETKLKIADLHLLLDDLPDVIKHCNEVLKSNRKDLYPHAYYNLGTVYLSMDNYKKAFGYMQKALKQSRTKDDQDDIKLGIYSLLCLQEKRNNLIPLFIQPFPISRDKKDIEALIETMYYQSIYEWLKGNIGQAVRRAKETIRLSAPQEMCLHIAYANHLLGIIHHEQEDYDQAEVHMDKALNTFMELKMDKATAYAHYARACISSGKGNFTQAFNGLNEMNIISRQINDTNLQYVSVMLKGRITEYLGRFDEAMLLYKIAMKIKPDAACPQCGISSVLLKKDQIDDAISLLSPLKTFESDEIQIRYLILKAVVYMQSVKVKQAKDILDRILKNISRNELQPAQKSPLILSVALLYTEMGFSKKALQLLKDSNNSVYPKSREAFVARIFTDICRFDMGEIPDIDLRKNIDQLKKMGCIYDIIYCNRIKYESIIRKNNITVDKKTTIEELNELKDISTAIGAVRECRKIEEILLNLYPDHIKELTKRQLSTEYLNMFTDLAGLINMKLGDEDFVQKLLDLVIQATNAERGALFLKSATGKLTFTAGQNLDKVTIKDARELSQTILKEVEKDNIIIARDALSDSNFSYKKSIILNQIRSLLCVPLSIQKNVVGALYLDSRKAADTFNVKDKEMLLSVSRILASVIDKSAAFRMMNQENLLLKAKMINDIGSGFVLGKSTQMKNVYQLINSVSETLSPVLLQGETGTGKGMLARLIHIRSKRSKDKFIVINCGAIPDTLLESELFGHKRGAFTGAMSDKKGLLEEADKGTVFLDEIANTSPAFQAKLLDTIEMKRIRRVGDTKMRSIDVRWIFATNRDLEHEIAQKSFREDLFYRINVVKIEIPPLRKRKQDIPVLAQFFLKKYSDEMGKQIKGFSAQALNKLKRYSWPGNVRELQNVIERAVVFIEGDRINEHNVQIVEESPKEIIKINLAKDRAVKKALIKALHIANWNVKKAAQMLGVNRKTVQRYMNEYNVKKPLK